MPLVALLAAGCKGDVLAPVDGAEPFDPPATYSVLWTEVETCSQLTGSMSLVNWYIVPGTTTFKCEYGACRGLWVAPHSIYLSDVAAHDFFGDDFFTVRHEILHDLVGHPGHPQVFEDCGLLRPDAPG
ncbi:MAG TPA: hypothetical protein VN803_13730 [Gemmatimonadales bacterium]|nr:hypothetical protein [Gemmatimonadales bacterium]